MCELMMYMSHVHALVLGISGGKLPEILKKYSYLFVFSS